MVRRRFLLGWVAAICIAWCGTDEGRIWKAYLEWYRRQPIAVSDLRQSYLDHLKRSGLGEAEARERSVIVERLSRERRDELHPLFFDRTYSSAAPRFHTGPNALLVESVRELKPGRALDIHMGQGRNAVFLASQGWDVTGFDFSAEGVRAAREAAARAGVTVTALVRRHEDFEFGRAQWNLVVMCYTWVPLRNPYIERILESLKPGGLVVFEHLMDQSGSERAAPWLPRPNELLRVFSPLRILRYEDLRAEADWSWRPERIARLVAEK
ncbi:MAG: class I SAM-dependent methyltransferase [Acidobacteria bacterium]|nr:class I SAM-dependent methyltransferase [Acidobacteriota bacterium]